MTYPPTFRIQITQLVTTRLMISTRLMILFVLVAGINKVDSVAAQGVTGTPILIQQPVGGTVPIFLHGGPPMGILS